MLKYICNYCLNCQIKLGFYKPRKHPISCLKNLSCLLAGVFITQSAINVSAEEFSPAEREFQNKQRQQSQEMQNLEILKQLQEQEKTSKPIPPKVIPPASQGGKAMLIKQITLDVGNVDVAQPEEIIKRYQGRALSNTDLVALLREINDYYAAQGYVTSMATIPAQDLSTGTLIIRMLWGKLSGFLINGQPPQGWYEHAMLVGAMPGIEGSIFNIHISDQIVENLNTAGKSVQVEVVPAQEQGYSYLNLNTSKRFFNRRTDDNAEHVNGGSWNVPIGYWSLGASYSNIQSQQLLQTVHGGDYHNASSIKDAKLKLNRVLTRDQSGKTNAWFEISNRNNATYFEGVLTKVSSRRYSQFTMGISKSMLIAGGGAYADLSWTRGVPWLNGYMESSTQANAQQTDFNLISSNLSWQRPGRLLGIPVSYELRAAVQYSQDIVLSKNRQYLGDEYSVRGYKDSPLSGDKGAYLSSTVSFPIQLEGQIAKVIRSISPLVGLDYGWAKNNWAGEKTNFISGMALGLKFDANSTQASLIWGLPIKSATTTDFGSVLYASLNYRF